MSGIEVSLQVRHRATCAVSMAQRHAEFARSMQQFGPPLGLAGLELPPMPEIVMGSGDLSSIEWFKYPIKGLKMMMWYMLRHPAHLTRDESMLDDNISIDFKTSNKALDYRALLHEQFPRVIEAFRGYRARALLGRHGMHYEDFGWSEWSGRETTNPVYRRLRDDPAINVDGRNNIYTLEPAVFWDGELCRRALGFDSDEAIRRLTGQVPLVRPLLDGVYVVFNDESDLSYDAFVEMNVRFKAILELI